MQLTQQGLAVAILPAIVFHGGKALLHPVLEAADGVEVAHLLIQLAQHRVGLVKAEEDLSRQRRKKGRKAQADALFQVQLAVHDILPLPAAFRPIRNNLFYHSFAQLRKFRLDCWGTI